MFYIIIFENNTEKIQFNNTININVKSSKSGITTIKHVYFPYFV